MREHSIAAPVYRAAALQRACRPRVLARGLPCTHGCGHGLRSGHLLQSELLACLENERHLMDTWDTTIGVSRAERWLLAKSVKRI
jgi:hypothetical protein